MRNGTGFVHEANVPSEGDSVTLGPYTVDIGESFAVEEFHLLLHCQKEGVQLTAVQSALLPNSVT